MGGKHHIFTIASAWRFQGFHRARCVTKDWEAGLARWKGGGNGVWIWGYGEMGSLSLGRFLFLFLKMGNNNFLWAIWRKSKVSKWFTSWTYSMYIYIHTYVYMYWLVVWNIFYFPYIGNNTPNWLYNIFQRGRVETTNQIINLDKLYLD